MLSITKTIVLQGLKGILVNAEVDISQGLPAWEIIGMADVGVKESKERVRTAIKNCGIKLLSRKYVINLSPANIKKEGSTFDLAIAVGILKTIGVIGSFDYENTIFIGELSLDGSINPVNGVLPMCIEGVKMGIKKAIVPKGNLIEARIVKDIESVGVQNLEELINYLNHKVDIYSEVENKEERFDEYDIDFEDVKGQESVKRALEVAVAGGHNCLMIGSPGSRKNDDGKKDYNDIT